MTKLDIKDAAFHYLRAEGGPTDMYGIYVFDSGEGRAPSFDEVLAHVAERVPNIPALNVVLREAVFNLDFPSWVVSTARVDDHLSDHDLDGGSWDECQRLVSTFLETGVDARVRPWHLHVVRGVEGVPTVRGRATVVVLQATHALTDGLGLAQLSGALFASAPELPISVGKRKAGPMRAVDAAVSLASIPVRLARYGYAITIARRRYARARKPASVRVGPATRLTARPTGSRAVNIVPLPASALRGLGVSMTSAALSAVSAATCRYLAEHGDVLPAALNASVPIALRPEVEWPSANRVLSGAVDLHPGEPNPLARARAIAESLASERRRVASPELIALARAEEHLPAPVVLLNRWIRTRRPTPAPTTVWTHTNVVSLDRGPAVLELCGSSVAFTCGTPMLTDGRSVVHGFFGVGDVVTVVVLACPDTVPDHLRYRDLLLEAVEEMSGAVEVPA